MSVHVNGDAAPAEQPFKISQLPKIGGCKFLVTTPTAEFVGIIECDYLAPQALSVLASILTQIAAQQSKQVMVAPAGAVPDIKGR